MFIGRRALGSQGLRVQEQMLEHVHFGSQRVPQKVALGSPAPGNHSIVGLFHVLWKPAFLGIFCRVLEIAPSGPLVGLLRAQLSTRSCCGGFLRSESFGHSGTLNPKP